MGRQDMSPLVIKYSNTEVNLDRLIHDIIANDGDYSADEVNYPRDPLPVVALYAALECNPFWAGTTDYDPNEQTSASNGGRGRWRWAKLKFRAATAKAIAPIRGKRAHTRVTFDTRKTK